MRPGRAAFALGLDIAQKGGDELEEQPHARRPPLTRSEQHVHGWTALHFPVEQHRQQAPGLQVGARREVIEARDSFARQHAVETTSRPVLHNQPFTLTDAFSVPRSNSQRSITMPAGLRISTHV